MTLTVVFLTAPSATLRHHSGRNYVSSANGIVKIPLAEAETVHVGQRLGFSGLTVDRPKPDGRSNWPPSSMFDESVGAVVYYVAGSNPAKWVDITGAAV
jgi:hypothetical protein